MRRPTGPGAANIETQSAVVPTYTVATVPAAASHSGRIIIVSDGDFGNPCMAYSNGSVWLNMGPLWGAISATVPSYTIASGVITAAERDFTIDTEGAAASDDLDTINGATPNAIITLRATSAARTVVVKDGTGNLQLAGDFSMDHSNDLLVLKVNPQGTTLRELARADNST
jgi:hypothetical protein